MKRILACGLIVLTPLFAQAQDPQLVNIAIKDLPVENGKVLDMEFHEIERNPDSSTVEIVRRSGGSVSSSMFIVRGLCQVMRARGAQYVTSERLTGEGERYKAIFPATPPESGHGFTMEQCGLVGY